MAFILWGVDVRFRPHDMWRNVRDMIGPKLHSELGGKHVNYTFYFCLLEYCDNLRYNVPAALLPWSIFKKKLVKHCPVYLNYRQLTTPCAISFTTESAFAARIDRCC